MGEQPKEYNKPGCFGAFGKGKFAHLRDCAKGDCQWEPRCKQLQEEFPCEATYDNSTAGRCPMTPQPKQESIIDKMMQDYDCIFFPMCWRARELLYCPKKAGMVDCEDYRSRPAPASASENIELYVLKVLSDSREEILERLSSPFSPETIREMQEITRKHDAAIAAKEREKVQPFIDLARVLATKCDEMQDLMRRNKIVIDNVQEPMQKLAFTFYSEIAELAHKAEVVIEEYEESLREGAGKPDKGR